MSLQELFAKFRRRVLQTAAVTMVICSVLVTLRHAELVATLWKKYDVMFTADAGGPWQLSLVAVAGKTEEDVIGTTTGVTHSHDRQNASIKTEPRQSEARSEHLYVIHTDTWGRTEGPFWLAPLPIHPYQICERPETITCTLRHEGKSRYLVLLWTALNGKRLFDGRNLSIDFQCCNGIIWTYTTDRSLLHEADVIEFQGHDIRNEADLQAVPKRSTDSLQLFSFYSWEAKPVLSDLFTQVQFNLQRTYRRNADMLCPYHKSGECFLNQSIGPLLVGFRDKLKVPVLAVVSNCRSYSGRERVLRGLVDLLDVHSAGRCLKNFHVQTEGLRKRSRMVKELGTEGPSRVDFIAKYKFVFAVENRLCQDYVTEKFWRSLESGSVPIVASHRGTPDYMRVAPHALSFLDVAAFSSMTDLAQAITQASENEETYLRYHQFREGHSTASPNPGVVQDSFMAEYEKTITSGADPESWCSLAKCLDDNLCRQRLRRRQLGLEDVQNCTVDYILKSNYQKHP